MIETVIEILLVVLIVAGVVILVLALAVGAMLGIIPLRILRKIHRAMGWFRWPKPKK
ncbi:MAG: hypothetical protein KAV43_04105 [Hadesarchaea archaeon]|nr:hypothetical protein [Hadesarchaea archaeon]